MKGNKDKNTGKMIFAIALAVLVLFVAQRVAGDTTTTDMGPINRGIFNLDENFLQDWQETVGDIFCSTVVFGGVDCWASFFCDMYDYPDDLSSGEGVAVATDPQTGIPYIAAHIEGERGPPLTVTNATTMKTSTYYPYKISFGIVDVEDEADLISTITLEGEEGTDVTHTVGTITVLDGGVYGLGGTTMPVFLSKNYYTTMKMTFDPKIRAGFSVSGALGPRSISDIGQITNTFVEIGTAPTTLGEEYEDLGGVGGTPAAATGGALTWS